MSDIDYAVRAAADPKECKFSAYNDYDWIVGEEGEGLYREFWDETLPDVLLLPDQLRAYAFPLKDTAERTIPAVETALRPVSDAVQHLRLAELPLPSLKALYYCEVKPKLCELRNLSTAELRKCTGVLVRLFKRNVELKRCGDGG